MGERIHKGEWASSSLINRLSWSIKDLTLSCWGISGKIKVNPSHLELIEQAELDVIMEKDRFIGTLGLLFYFRAGGSEIATLLQQKSKKDKGDLPRTFTFLNQIKVAASIRSIWLDILYLVGTMSSPRNSTLFLPLPDLNN
jgi:hypothetical protein